MRNFKHTHIVLILLFCLPLPVFGARLSFSPDRIDVPPGEPFSVNVILDNEAQVINALEGGINFPADNLELEEIKSGDSIIGFWLESPTELEKGHVSFAGIIPGGFSGVLSPFYTGGRPGKVFTLIFRGRQSGDVQVEWQSPRALLNDGLGEAVEMKLGSLGVSLRDGVANSSPVAEVSGDDRIPPETFSPEISHDPNLFSGRWFVVFSTRDNRSGLAGYQVQEHSSIAPNDNDWRDAVSPYLLRDQTRQSYVSIRAIDQAGNKRVVTLSPAIGPYHYSWSNFWSIIISFLLLFFILWLRKHFSSS
ncbi:hypothetical protein IT398_00835 [Candidatus Nomurabacteria bacterium]|nr:hypothetical protein [Candidatus Nomurabacteria bacterium]